MQFPSPYWLAHFLGFQATLIKVAGSHCRFLEGFRASPENVYTSKKKGIAIHKWIVHSLAVLTSFWKIQQLLMVSAIGIYSFNIILNRQAVGIPFPKQDLSNYSTLNLFYVSSFACPFNGKGWATNDEICGFYLHFLAMFHFSYIKVTFIPNHYYSSSKKFQHLSYIWTV